MPELNEDLRHVPWVWRMFGMRWVLTTRHGGPKVILSCQPVGKFGAMLTVRNQNGVLVELTPDHPIGRALANLPGLYQNALAVAAKEDVPGDDLTVDTARALVAAIGEWEDQPDA